MNNQALQKDKKHKFTHQKQMNYKALQKEKKHKFTHQKEVKLMSIKILSIKLKNSLGIRTFGKWKTT